MREEKILDFRYFYFWNPYLGVEGRRHECSQINKQKIISILQF